jgi:serine/threonine protein kinase
MGFSVGDRLGRFEIIGALGAGGMGEVYRARDSQLRRDVAIKGCAARSRATRSTSAGSSVKHAPPPA